MRAKKIDCDVKRNILNWTIKIKKRETITVINLVNPLDNSAVKEVFQDIMIVSVRDIIGDIGRDKRIGQGNCYRFLQTFLFPVKINYEKGNMKWYF